MALHHNKLGNYGESVRHHGRGGWIYDLSAFLQSVDCSAREWRSIMSLWGQGRLRTANATIRANPSLSNSDSCEILRALSPEGRVRNVLVRVVEDLLHGLVIEA